MSSLPLSTGLLAAVFADIRRHWLRLLLFLMILLSSASVILSTHYFRQTNIELERLMQQRDQLDVEWRHLVLEQGTLAEHSRVESLVKNELNMRRPRSKDEVLVRVR